MIKAILGNLLCYHMGFPNGARFGEPNKSECYALRAKCVVIKKQKLLNKIYLLVHLIENDKEI